MSVRSIILCEGFDDIYILGYYLFKTDSWEISKRKSLSDLYTLATKTSRNERIDIYEKNNDLLAIWGIGGCANLKKGFKAVKSINENNPEQGISKIFILMDRDSKDINECLDEIKSFLIESGIKIEETLINNFCNVYRYTVEGDDYELKIIPIVIPFEENGALETILMSAIKEKGKEEERIVDNATSYVNNFISEERLTQYLSHERLVLKAKFSSVISITNPDRSTALFDTLLMSHEWEEREEVKKHLKVLNEFL